MKTLTAAEANRSFSALLRQAAAGERVVITSHGRPVAEIGPVREDTATREKAFAKLMARLRSQQPTLIQPWTREDLYEREPRKHEPDEREPGGAVTIALDTNILVYAEALVLTPTDQPKVQRIEAMLPALGVTGLVISVQALGELFSVLIRRGGFAREAARQRTQDWVESAVLIPATDMATMAAAQELSARHGLQIWDAVILAAAAEAGARMLLSEDMQDGFTWRGVTVANPFAATPHPLLRPYIPPL